MGHNDVAPIMPPETLARFAKQMAKHAPSHILQIDRPLPQVWVINGRESADELLGNRVKNKFRIMALLTDPSENLLDQAGVFEHQEMGVKNPRISGCG